MEPNQMTVECIALKVESSKWVHCVCVCVCVCVCLRACVRECVCV